MQTYDSSHLLRLLRQHTRIPSAPGFSDDDCLRALTATIHGYALPLVKAEVQGHWATADSAASVQALQEGVAEYEIPSRAVAASVEKAVLVGPQGERALLTLREIGEMEELSLSPGLPQWYTVTSNRIHLYPAPSGAYTGWSLRLVFLVRPAALVLPTACCRVGAKNAPSGGYVTLNLSNAASPDFSDDGVGDVVRRVEPYETTLLEIETVWDTTTSVDVPESVADTINVGDYLCPAGQSLFPQLPVEMLDLVARRTAVDMLVSVGDNDVAAAKAAPLTEGRTDALKLVKPRTGEPRRLPNGMNKWRGGGWGGW